MSKDALVSGAWQALPTYLVNNEPGLREGELMEDLALIFDCFPQHFSKTTHTVNGCKASQEKAGLV